MKSPISTIKLQMETYVEVTNLNYNAVSPDSVIFRHQDTVTEFRSLAD